MKRRKGFTLIELMLVIVIIGILAAAVFAAIGPAMRARAIRAGCQSAATQVWTAAETFRMDKGAPPAGAGDLTANGFLDVGVPASLLASGYKLTVDAAGVQVDRGAFWFRHNYDGTLSDDGKKL